MKVTKPIAMLGIAFALCATIAVRTNAQCGVSLNRNQVALRTALPSAAMPMFEERSTVKDLNPRGGDDGTIVGLWDVRFIVDGQVVDEGFDQYHSDGTEILNDTPPPAAGNVCLGVYARTSASSIKLRHPSWIYDSTNTIVIGRATILEKITVDKSGRSFKGTFTIQFRDLAGNELAPDFSGTLRGDRITPD